MENPTATCAAVLSACLLLLSVPRIQAQDGDGDPTRCSLQTLKGSYGSLYTGYVLDFPNPGQNPIVIQGTDTYDGAGHISQSASSMLAGTLQFETKDATGTYTVNTDCSGSFQVKDLPSASFRIVKHGTEILGILTTQPFTISFHSEKQ